MGVSVEDGRHEGRRGPVVDRGRDPLAHRVRRQRRHLDDLEPRLPQPVELPPERVELEVGRHQPRPLAEGQGRDPLHEQVVGRRGERDRSRRAAQESPVSLAHPLGARERMRPLLVHVLGGVQPRLLLPFEPPVRPCLVAVAGQEEPLANPEVGVVGRERVRAAAEILGRQHRARSRRSPRHAHSSVRIAQRSGKKGSDRVVRRYPAPALPPVPGRAPIVRSTILTCR